MLRSHSLPADRPCSEQWGCPSTLNCILSQRWWIVDTVPFHSTQHKCIHYHNSRSTLFTLFQAQHVTSCQVTHCLNTTVAAYLVQHVPSRQTHSAASPLLSVPRLTTDFARRSCSYATLVIWNSLPTQVMLCNSEHSFKRHLKTFLFNCCHQTVWPVPHQRLCSRL